MSSLNPSKVYMFNLRNSNHTLDLNDNLRWIREINVELDELVSRINNLSIQDTRRIDELEAQMRRAEKRNRELRKEMTEIEREYQTILNG